MNRSSAGSAEFALANLKPVDNRNAFVKDKALASPEAFGFGDPLQVLQDATFEVMDLENPSLFEQSGRFLATDATGTEHRDARLLGRVDVRFKPRPLGPIARSVLCVVLF